MEANKITKGSEKKIGLLMLEQGIITREQLKEALDLHQKERACGEKKNFGQILIELGFVNEETLTSVVACQAGVDFIRLENYIIDKTATTLIDSDSIRRYRAIPIGFENGLLVVAMSDPNDILAIDDIRLISGYEIKPVCASESELKALIDQHARISSDSLVDEVDIEQDQTEKEDQQASLIGKPAVQLANLIFNQAAQDGASDIHIEPQDKDLRVRFRIDGVLHEVMQPPYKLYLPLVSRIKVVANMDIANRRVPQDGRISLKLDRRMIDLRVASLPTAYGEKITLRLLDRSAQIITLSELGFPDSQLKLFRKLINKPHGCMLVTGPTGSGKTTTLYAGLTELNSVEKNIITVEDPIEYRLAGINQIQINPRAGLTFASGLKSILRNDPDIIMIGEIRDHETARISVESALTGHMVLSTLHTNDAAGAITRLGDMGIESYLTASSVIAVLAQRLVRLLCNYCREEQTLGREELLASIPDFPLRKDERDLKVYKPVGCLRCARTGYKGRRGVYELLIISEKIKHLTLQRSSAGEIHEAAVSEGMISLRQDGLMKVRAGLTSLEEVLRVLP